MSIKVFPVSADGYPSYTDDFGVTRSNGRTHQGNDIFGATGTALFAVDDGVVSFGTDPLGGIVANLIAGDGTRYYYAHLERVEGVARVVTAGDVIGYLDSTGNAAHTAPHLHFEMHPGGGAAVDPYAQLRAAPLLREGQSARQTVGRALLVGSGVVGFSLLLAYVIRSKRPFGMRPL